MPRSFGLSSHPSAQEQLQKSFPPPAKRQPLPPGSPGTASAGQLGITEADPLTFFVIGDHGGVKTPAPQNAVSSAMQETTGPRPAFVYSVGDIVYFNGDADQYSPQFYEPYGHLAVPIVAIPGNHDGDVAVDDAGNPTGRQPLDTFMANCCTQKPDSARRLRARVQPPHSDAAVV